MATYSVWQAAAIGGSPLSLKPGTSITVNREADGALVPLKADRLGAGSKDNPFTVGSDGIARFYAAAGRYRITATLSGHDPIEWKDVALGTAAETDIDLLSGNVTFNGPIEYDQIVADITERDAITGVPVGWRVLVSDIGDGRTAYYELLDDSPQTWSDPLVFQAADGALRYDVAQTLSRIQKAQAQANAGLFELYVTPEAYGALGDYGSGNTDDTAAFAAASAFLSGTFKGGKIKCRHDRQYLIDDDLALDAGVWIEGALGMPAQGALLNGGSALRLNTANSITIASSGGLRGVAVINKDITSHPRQDNSTNYIADATANLALFAGTAVILDGVDIGIENVFVAGFEQCFDGDGCHRLRMTHVMFDGINGVKLGNMLDVSRLYDVHGFPLLTSGLASLNTERTLWTRSGIAFNLYGVNDGLTLTACFAFCYAQGFTNSGGQSVIFTDCWADYFAELQATTTFGFHLVSNAKLTQLNGCRASSVGRGLVLNTIDATTVVGFKSWACAATHIECLDGYTTLISPDMRVYGQTGTLKGLVVGSGVEEVRVNSPTFRDFSTSYEIDSSATAKVHWLGEPIWINCTDTVQPGLVYVAGDANLTITPYMRHLTMAAFTAPRTWTLPAANSVKRGTEIIIEDSAAALTSTNTLTIQRAGSDTINGGTSIVLNNTYARTRLISNGVARWNIEAIGTSQIASKAVTYAKIQDVSATSRLLGRITSGAGSVEELTAANVKTILGYPTSTTDNTVPRFNGTSGDLQTSGVSIDDTDNVTIPNTLNVNGVRIRVGVDGSNFFWFGVNGGSEPTNLAWGLTTDGSNQVQTAFFSPGAGGGLTITKATRITAAFPVKVPSYVVASLPTGQAGDMAFASNGRTMAGSTGAANITVQGAGSGTGTLVVSNGTNWQVCGTTATVAA